MHLQNFTDKGENLELIFWVPPRNDLRFENVPDLGYKAFYYGFARGYLSENV